ncbi:MAG: ParB/RepB/Spo0J family partition protein [Gemmatimonadaceae bacterium]
MATPEKPTRLGRGLDALLARRDVLKTPAGIASSVANDAQTDNTRIAPATHSSDAVASQKNLNEELAKGNATADASNSTDAAPKMRTPGLLSLPIAHIAANPFQPRKEFRPEDLADLEASLRISGLLQPITVRPSPHHTGYELIAGERRLRAATRLGWAEIPALVREADDRAMLTLAMVENLQRADLDPIEEADGYQRLIDDFDLTQQEVADVVGKDRSTIANALRLLALPASVRRMLQERQITVGHARALLPLGAERAMAELAREITAKTLSVRDVEERVRGARPTPATSGRKSKTSSVTGTPATFAANAETRRVEELLRKKLLTTVNLHLTGKQAGEVRIAFFSNDDLERVLLLLGIHLDG